MSINFGAIPLSSDILTKANIGLWAFELDEGQPPRMYGDEAMLRLVGLDHQVPPEEMYHAWYDHIDEGSYDLVADAVDKMMVAHAEVQYPWHHPDGHTIIVRCGGVRNPAYTKGIRIEGTHQNVTEVLHYEEVKLAEQKKQFQESLEMANRQLKEALATASYETKRNDVLTEIISGTRFTYDISADDEVVGAHYSEVSKARIGEEHTRTPMGWFELLHPEDKQRVYEAFMATVRDHTGQTAYDETFRMLGTSGKYRWVRSGGNVIRRPDGSGEFFGISLDMTNQMEEQQKRLLGAVPISPDILAKENIGMWAFELDEGQPPRMYGDEAMIGLVGLDHQVPPEEMYHAWYDHIDEGSYGLVADAVDKMMNGEHAEVQYPWHHPNGHTMIVRCGGVRNPEYTKGIRVEGTHQNVTDTLHYDIRDRKAAEERIKAFAKEYDVAFLCSLTDGSYKVLAAADAVLQRQKMDYATFSEAMAAFGKLYGHPKERELFRAELYTPEAFRQRLQVGESYSMEYRSKTTGNYLWYRANFIRSGEDEVLVGFRNCDEEAFTRLVNQKLLGEYDSLFLVDLDADDAHCLKPSKISETGAFTERVQYSAQLRKFTELVAAPYKQDWINFCNPELMKQYMAGEEYREYYYTFADSPDAVRRFRVDVIERNDKGEAYFLLLAFTGIDEQRSREMLLNRRLAEQHTQLEEALALAQSASKAKTDFLFNMSHDIRTPMNAIIGFTELAKKHASDTEKVEDCLNKIDASGKHLLSLINDVLDMSRVEAGKLKSELKTVNIRKAAEKLVTICKESAEEKNIKLYLESLEIRDENVEADELHIDQIFMNILGNAIKYTLPGGSVLLIGEQLESAVAGYGHYSFTVKDTGIGMSEEFLGKIYDSFSREETSTTSGIQGTGLGMAIVKRLVDYMDGTINIQSEQGVGTTVTVTLYMKLAESAAANEETADISGIDCTGRKVLLVEDNDLNREIAMEILKEKGFLVEEAVNGREAVECVRSKEAGYYDIVLMDIQMPFMDGYEATKEIRKLSGAEALPIIALSANAFEEDRQKSREAGMNDHVAKPIDVGVLMATLSKFL